MYLLVIFWDLMCIYVDNKYDFFWKLDYYCLVSISLDFSLDD